MAYRNILVEMRGKVGLITLNRPDALNALNDELMQEVAAAIEVFEADAGVGCIVLTGSAKAFAAGADIAAMRDWNHMDVFQANFLSGDWERVAACRKPVIAAVSGYALGGGCELAMMCDFILAAENAQFGQPEVKIGTLPGLGGSQRLTRAVGKAKAMELCLTGRMMDAQEAERAGLVARIVPTESLLDEALATAEKIAAFSQPVVMMVKEAVNRAFESSLQEGLLFERRTFHASFGLEDRKEGMTAFLEKRKPQFKHR